MEKSIIDDETARTPRTLYLFSRRELRARERRHIRKNAFTGSKTSVTRRRNARISLAKLHSIASQGPAMRNVYCHAWEKNQCEILRNVQILLYVDYFANFVCKFVSRRLCFGFNDKVIYVWTWNLLSLFISIGIQTISLIVRDRIFFYLSMSYLFYLFLCFLAFWDSRAFV